MSTPHYEYPSATRMTWPPFSTTASSSPTSKMLESCQMTLSPANKLTESCHGVSAALPTSSVHEQWRHFTPEQQFFSQCQYSCQFDKIEQKASIREQQDIKPLIASTAVVAKNEIMLPDSTKHLHDYLSPQISSSNSKPHIRPLSPTSTSDLMSEHPDSKDNIIGIRSVSPSSTGIMGSPAPSSTTTSRCTAAPASSTSLSPTSPGSVTDINSLGKSKKKRKPRTCFSVGQMLVLENTFQQTKYVSITDRGKLAGSLGLTDSQIKVWFQNRRSKWRKTMDSKDHHSNLRHISSCAEQPPSTISQQYYWPTVQHQQPTLGDYSASPLQNSSVDHHNLYNGYNPYRHMVG